MKNKVPIKRKNHSFLLIICIIFVSFLLVGYFSKRLLLPSYQMSPTPSHNVHSEPTTPSNVVLMFGGDVMLGRSVEIETRKQNDVRYPFLKIGEEFSKSDIAFVNLENPILPDCPRHDGGFIFCANPDMADGLTYAGIDIVSLANNHTRNYGQKGIDESVRILNEKGIAHTGLGELTVIEKSGTKFGFVGFDKSQLGNPALTAAESKLVEESNAKVDVLIVAMHWGVEYQDTGLPGVKRLARVLVEKGADVVVGAHPHWVQDSEYIEGKPVYYSLGNLIFDQMWSEPTKKGLIVRLTFENKTIVKEEFLPTYIRNTGQPEFVQ